MSFTETPEWKAAMASRFDHLDRKKKTTVEPPPRPAVLVPEHELKDVEPSQLPKSARPLLAAAAAGWTLRWFHVETERLRDPIRGGDSYGVRYSHLDGRWGWATWTDGAFQAPAILYGGPRAVVPRSLMKLRDLKEELSR